MIQVNYHPEQGVVLPDALVEPFVNDLLEKHLNTPDLFEIQVGSEQIMTMFRVLMMEKEIPHGAVSFTAYNLKTKKLHHVRIMDGTDNYCYETYEHFYDLVEGSLVRLLKW